MADNTAEEAVKEQLREISRDWPKGCQWDEESLVVWLRADFKCEYCDKQMMHDVDSYRDYQHDHIMPYSETDLSREFSGYGNIALTCYPCHCFKHCGTPKNWNPNVDVDTQLYELGLGITDDVRMELVHRTREHVQQQRKKWEDEYFGKSKAAIDIWQSPSK